MRMQRQKSTALAGSQLQLQANLTGFTHTPLQPAFFPRHRLVGFPLEQEEPCASRYRVSVHALILNHWKARTWGGIEGRGYGIAKA